MTIRRFVRGLGALGLVLLAGCVTAPPAFRVPGSAASWLGGTPNVVIRLDAAKVTAWTAVTASREDLKEVGARTRVVWAALDIDRLEDLKSTPGQMRTVLEGDFPRTAASLMLSMNSSWKQEPEGGVWTNPKLDLSVSVPDEGLVTVRRHDPSAPRISSDVLRDLDPAEVEKAAVWVTLWAPGRVLFGDAGSRLITIDRLDIVLNPEGNNLAGPIVLTFPSDRAAKAGATILTMFGKVVREKIGQDLDWTVQGPVVTGSTFRVKQTDLKALAAKLLGANL